MSHSGDENFEVSPRFWKHLCIPVTDYYFLIFNIIKLHIALKVKFLLKNNEKERISAL
jgi:hypothetical protein